MNEFNKTHIENVLTQKEKRLELNGEIFLADLNLNVDQESIKNLNNDRLPDYLKFITENIEKNPPKVT